MAIKAQSVILCVAVLWSTGCGYQFRVEGPGPTMVVLLFLFEAINFLHSCSSLMLNSDDSIHADDHELKRPTLPATSRASTGCKIR